MQQQSAGVLCVCKQQQCHWQHMPCTLKSGFGLRGCRGHKTACSSNSLPLYDNQGYCLQVGLHICSCPSWLTLAADCWVHDSVHSARACRLLQLSPLALVLTGVDVLLVLPAAVCWVGCSTPPALHSLLLGCPHRVMPASVRPQMCRQQQTM